MAENIVKLRVDSKEYEAKLERARQGLQHLENELQKVGQNFTHASKEQVQYVQQLGQMGTVSQTVRGKIGEMTKTFTELAVKYKQLSQEEKASPFGQALSASLDQLRTRIQDSRQQLDEVTRSLSDTKQEGGATGGVIEQLAGKFTISLDAVKLFNVGLQATQAVLSVAKDAFFASEANVDEWGRIVDSSKSLYEGFLNSINNGDISGFLGRIDQIVTAARAAYDELDRLGTMKTIQAPAISAQQTENERMRMMIQTGRYIAPTDGRRAAMANGAVLSPDQIKRLEQRLQSGMNNVVKLVGNEVKQTSKAIDAIYNRQAKEIGMSVSEFRRGTSSMAEFDRRVQGASNYRKWQQDHSYVDQSTGRLVAPRTGNPYAQFKGWDVFRVDGQRYNDLVQLIRQRDQQAGQSYSMQSQAYRTMNRAEGITLRQIMGGTGGSTGGGKTTKQEIEAVAGSIDAQAKKVQELQKAWRAAADDDSRQKIKKQIEEAQFALDILEGKTSGIPQMNYGLGDLAGKGGSGLFQDPLFKQKTYDSNNEFSKAIAQNQWQLDDKAVTALGDYISKSGELAEGGKAVSDSWKNAASSIQSVGQALSSIDDPAAKIMGTIAQAVATIALTFAESLKGTFTPWDWIAAAATGTATMISTIEAIRSATAGGFANGGIVPGNSFSGDNLRTSDYGINSGELILNRAQQNTVASMLTQSREPIMLEAVVSAEQIQFVTGNRDRRRGRSEYIKIQ